MSAHVFLFIYTHSMETYKKITKRYKAKRWIGGGDCGDYDFDYQ
jgi:hypothetical protein